MANRLPAELGDAIKGQPAAFFMAQKELTPDELFDVLPVAYPMTHQLPEFPGVARYPVDAWAAMGSPC